MTKLSSEFKGDRILVLAAYNAGRGNVKNWLHVEEWTGGLENIEQIPFPETRYYILKVLWNYKVYSPAITIYVEYSKDIKCQQGINFSTIVFYATLVI